MKIPGGRRRRSSSRSNNLPTGPTGFTEAGRPITFEHLAERLRSHTGAAAAQLCHGGSKMSRAALLAKLVVPPTSCPSSPVPSGGNR